MKTIQVEFSDGYKKVYTNIHSPIGFCHYLEDEYGCKIKNVHIVKKNNDRRNFIIIAIVYVLISLLMSLPTL